MLPLHEGSPSTSRTSRTQLTRSEMPNGLAFKLRLRSPQARDALTPPGVDSVIVCVEKLRQDEIIEHSRADGRVDTG